MRAQSIIDTAAIGHNVRQLAGVAAPAELCAVVKANAYGHGALRVARTALDAGARWLAVATAMEAAELRAGGISAPLLVLGALNDRELDVAVGAGADVVAWTERFVDAIRACARAPVGVHVKLDTGMGRLGTRDVDVATQLAHRIAGDPRLMLRGLMTHLATADDDWEYARAQLREFTAWTKPLCDAYPHVIRHAANSGATLAGLGHEFELVRCGIALYGLDPFYRDGRNHGLRPALQLTSYVADVKSCQSGESVGYGRRFVAKDHTWVATVPIGYADGVRRCWSGRVSVLIEGRRCPIVGAISMDHLTVDVGAFESLAGALRGATVTLIGPSGDEAMTAEEIAQMTDTIPHEVVCLVSARVPRVYREDVAQ